MSTFTKGLIIIVVTLAVGAGLVFWKDKIGGHHAEGDFSKVTKEQMQVLIKDFNPMQLKTLSENPEQKKKLAEELEQLLSIASQAKKEGIDQKPNVKQELESMEKAILAINYDQKINKDKGNLPPFSFIKEDRVNEFWNGGNASGFLSGFFNKRRAERRENEFKEFIDVKLELARSRGQLQPGQEPSEEELKQAKEAFAKTRIYYDEAEEKLSNLSSLPEAEKKDWEEFKESVEVQTMLQKAQFLTQTYVQDVLAKKLEVTDAEVQKYIKAHPELAKTEEKKAKADEIVQKINSGGDFAELAKEYSEDPGSKDSGGLYEGVTMGQFAPEFEKAALALEPGDVAPNPVKTKFGYHIIKLVKKGETNDLTGNPQTSYDVRHILISTMMKDPNNPTGRDAPIEDFVKAQLEQEKQKEILEEIKKNNHVEVATDFEIPKVSEAEIKKMQEQQQMQMQKQLEQMQQQQPPAEAPKEAEPKKENK
ncbi:MAG: peptidylprolyl isomerase [Aridibacter sp.]